MERKLLFKETDRKSVFILNKFNTNLGNFEEELPKPTVGKLSPDSGPSANRQATDRSIRLHKQLTDMLPTDQLRL